MGSFFSSYLASIIERDLGDVASLRAPDAVERLLHVVAARTGGLMSFQGMGRDLGLDKNTVHSYTRALENLFLVHQLKPWHEVKAGATVGGNDLAGLRRLRDRLGERFTCGVVLYPGERTLPFGDRLWIVPLAALWSQ